MILFELAFKTSTLFPTDPLHEFLCFAIYRFMESHPHYFELLPPFEVLNCTCLTFPFTAFWGLPCLRGNSVMF